MERVLQLEETDYELFRKLALSEEDFVQLKAFADSIGIALFSAPFDVQSLNQLTAIGLQDFKVASSELTNHGLMAALGKGKNRIILSTGMSSLADIEESLRVFIQNGGKILHYYIAFLLTLPPALH